MIFGSHPPIKELKTIIKEFWVYENPDETPSVQKVIPDGYSEIIIHYGDICRINLKGSWEDQERLLFSNQISSFFHLENTGRSAMIGVKLFPEAGFELFGKDMADCTDQVLPLESLGVDTSSIHELIDPDITTRARIESLENWIIQLNENIPGGIDIVKEATKRIFESNGMIDVQEISNDLNISIRQLERQFKKVVGTTIKFFSRIIRFNYIFQLMEKNEMSWIQIALESGFFDQSHFIKNFKEFTGEEPSSYGFDDQTLANFFLKK